jgi:hypothetical protein
MAVEDNKTWCATVSSCFQATCTTWSIAHDLRPARRGPPRRSWLPAPTLQACIQASSSHRVTSLPLALDPNSSQIAAQGCVLRPVCAGDTAGAWNEAPGPGGDPRPRRCRRGAGRTRAPAPARSPRLARARRAGALAEWLEDHLPRRLGHPRAGILDDQQGTVVPRLHAYPTRACQAACAWRRWLVGSRRSARSWAGRHLQPQRQTSTCTGRSSSSSVLASLTTRSTSSPRSTRSSSGVTVGSA